MRGKRGIIGTVIIGFVLALVIIILFLYWQVKANGIEFKTGNLVVDIKYVPEEKDNQEKDKIITNQTINNNQTNESESNLLFETEDFSISTQRLSEELENMTE